MSRSSSATPFDDGAGGLLLNAHAPFELYADLFSADAEGLTFQWFYRSGPGELAVGDRVTGGAERTLGYAPWSLGPGTYTYQCTATSNRIGTFSQVQSIVFTLNGAPGGGSLSVSGGMGTHIAPDGEFAFSAAGFADADGPVELKLVYFRAESGAREVVVREFSADPIEAHGVVLLVGDVSVYVVACDALGRRPQ